MTQALGAPVWAPRPHTTLAVVAGEDLVSVARNKLKISLVLASAPLALAAALLLLRWATGLLRPDESKAAVVLLLLAPALILAASVSLRRTSSWHRMITTFEMSLISALVDDRRSRLRLLIAGIAFVVSVSCFALGATGTTRYLFNWYVFGALFAWWAFLATAGLAWVSRSTRSLSHRTVALVTSALVATVSVIVAFSIPSVERHLAARLVTAVGLHPTPPAAEISVEQTSRAINADMMSYLDRRVAAAAIAREARWALDFSSQQRYLASLAPHRKRLEHMLGVPEECLRSARPELVSSTHLGTFDAVRIDQWVLAVCDGALTTYALIALPAATRGPLPAVIAFHGTRGTPQRVMGVDGVGDYHRRFGWRLARQGYVVVAPHLTTGTGRVKNQGRNELDRRALPVGTRVTGIEIGKTISAIDHLTALDFVDGSRLSTYGISLGGQMSLYLAALDERIRLTVVSGYVADRTEQLTGRDNPNALWRLESAGFTLTADELHHFTDVEVAALIAPRKLFIEAGSQDHLTAQALRVFPQIDAIYERLELGPGSVAMGVEDGGHEAFLRQSLRWMNQWLKP
jgi:dienelactone hydrolase